MVDPFSWTPLVLRGLTKLLGDASRGERQIRCKVTRNIGGVCAGVGDDDLGARSNTATVDE